MKKLVLNYKGRDSWSRPVYEANERLYVDVDPRKDRMVIILDDIEYASGGGKSKDNQNTDQAANSAPAVPEAAPAAPQAPTNGGFTGYEPFGGNSFFDEN